MINQKTEISMPAKAAAIAKCGYAIWASADEVDAALMAHFDTERLPVAAICHVRIWGLQVDDERELPGLEKNQYTGRGYLGDQSRGRRWFQIRSRLETANSGAEIERCPRPHHRR